MMRETIRERFFCHAVVDVAFDPLAEVHANSTHKEKPTMQHHISKVLFLLFALVGLGALTACQPVQPVAAQPAAQTSTLATAKIFVQNSNMPGRALVSARGNHFIVSSAPPLGHHSEEINPLEAMLAALATCGIFVHETAAIEQGIPLNHIDATVQADWDVRGLRGEDFDSSMQAIRVHLNLDGPDDAQIEALREEFTSRCPIYTTLIRATDITITANDEAMGGKIAEELVTATITATLTNQAGRALVGARHNLVVVDSVPPLGSPSEEANAFDYFLSAPATCGSFIMEQAAAANGIPLANVAATVEADLDPRGVRGEDVSPRVQAMRVHWLLSGVDEAQAEMLVDEWYNRCPIYNTLIKATDITATHEVVEGAIAMPE
jgi:uncharacterized OsmC-like protein